MTFKQLCLELCKREKGRRQVSITDMRETLGAFADIVYESDLEAMKKDSLPVQFHSMLHRIGKNRAASKKSAKNK